MYVVIYSQVNSDCQDNDLLTINLKRIAEGKGWYVKRTFQEKSFDIPNAIPQSELKSLLNYVEKTEVNAVVVSEISAIGDRVSDIMNRIEFFHDKGIAIFINQFNLLTFENGKENPSTKILLQALSIGSQIEKNRRLTKQREGIKLARKKGVYVGRKLGAKTTPDALLNKYKNIAELIDKRKLSIRAIAKITNHSINTVRKVKKLKVV